VPIKWDDGMGEKESESVGLRRGRCRLVSCKIVLRPSSNWVLDFRE